MAAAVASPAIAIENSPPGDERGPHDPACLRLRAEAPRRPPSRRVLRRRGHQPQEHSDAQDRRDRGRIDRETDEGEEDRREQVAERTDQRLCSFGGGPGEHDARKERPHPPSREPRHLGHARDEDGESEDGQQERLVRAAEEHLTETHFDPQRDHQQHGDRHDRDDGGYERDVGAACGSTRAARRTGGDRPADRRWGGGAPEGSRSLPEHAGPHARGASPRHRTRRHR